MVLIDQLRLTLQGAIPKHSGKGTLKKKNDHNRSVRNCHIIGTWGLSFFASPVHRQEARIDHFLHVHW